MFSNNPDARIRREGVTGIADDWVFKVFPGISFIGRGIKLVNGTDGINRRA
jgi:hypothetical protein